MRKVTISCACPVVAKRTPSTNFRPTQANIDNSGSGDESEYLTYLIKYFNPALQSGGRSLPTHIAVPLISSRCDASGDLEQIKTLKLTLTRQDGQPMPATGIVAEFGQKTVTFTVTSAKKDVCGSMQYLGKISFRPEFGPRRTTTMKLQDNGTRLCRDLRPGAWEVTIQSFSDFDGANVLNGSIQAYGNPEGVITIQ